MGLLNILRLRKATYKRIPYYVEKKPESRVHAEVDVPIDEESIKVQESFYKEHRDAEIKMLEERIKKKAEEEK